MNFPLVLAISFGASCGALLRWGLSISMNAILPFIPLGTLTANLMGGFLMGIFMSLSQTLDGLSEEMRLAVSTGFLGGLTTFSAFSAESILLWNQQEHLWFGLLIFCHVVGSISATLMGIYAFRFVTP